MLDVSFYINSSTDQENKIFSYFLESAGLNKSYYFILHGC